jgi:hypothetical protein
MGTVALAFWSCRRELVVITKKWHMLTGAPHTEYFGSHTRSVSSCLAWYAQKITNPLVTHSITLDRIHPLYYTYIHILMCEQDTA